VLNVPISFVTFDMIEIEENYISRFYTFGGMGQNTHNTISTLDALSKSMIPNLAKGCCIITGTSFDFPLVIQVKRVDKSFQPDSDDVDLENLWK